MKRVLVILTLISLFTLTACSSSGNAGTNNRDGKEKQEQTAGSKGKTLIVYFSHSGTTEKIAKTIGQDTNGDIFKIETATPYPENNDLLGKQAEKEHNENYLPPLKNKINNIGQYETIFIGYPVWQGTFPQPIASFLTEYDLSGKTIVPFCTYGSTGFGSSVSKIKELAPKATVFDGLAVQSAKINNAQKDISEWLRKLKVQIIRQSR